MQAAVFYISSREDARQRQRFHKQRAPEASAIIHCVKDDSAQPGPLPIFAKCVTVSPVTLSPALPRACILSDFPDFDAKQPCFSAMTLSQLCPSLKHHCSLISVIPVISF